MIQYFHIPFNLRGIIKEGKFISELLKLEFDFYDTGDTCLADYFYRNISVRTRLATNRYIEVKIHYIKEEPTSPFRHVFKTAIDEFYGTAKSGNSYLPLFELGVTPWEILCFENATFAFFHQVAVTCAEVLDPHTNYDLNQA